MTSEHDRNGRGDPRSEIERLRQADESLDALIEVITGELSLVTESSFTARLQPRWTAALIDAVADRVLKEISRLSTECKLQERLRKLGQSTSSK